MQPDRRLPLDRDFVALERRVNRLERKLGLVGGVPGGTVAVGTVAKRFRIAVFVTPLVVLGGQVSAAIKWSTPMPSDVYNVDAACSAMNTSGMVPTVTNQTKDGCTVSFVAPFVLAAGTVVVVLGVSPAPIT